MSWDPQHVIDEARPMLETFLCDIGLHPFGSPLDFPLLLDKFSRWNDAQPVAESDRVYLASRLGAFICEYLTEVHSGQRVVKNGRIVMEVSVQAGVVREFDPYEVAIGMATNRNGLEAFLDTFKS
jgi:hypothetical protein